MDTMIFRSFPKSLCWLLYVLILAVLGTKYLVDSALIREGNEKQIAWEEIEAETESLVKLSKAHSRFAIGNETLKGWRSSRYSWSEILLSITSELPGESQDIQLNRLQFDEEIVGLRNFIPGEEVTKFYPLKRKVEISLSGVIKSDRPESELLQFQNNLQNFSLGNFGVDTISLDYFNMMMSEDRKPTDLTRFAFSVNLLPNELTP